MTTRKKPWLGWHWLLPSRKLQYAPFSRVRSGRALKARGALSLCHNGMHASRRALDALNYAPGPVICRVILEGEIIEGDDKACARIRKCLWMADATEVLHRFACRVAWEALKAERNVGREPPAASWEAIRVKLRWLSGKATTEELSAAWSAAGSAADSPAESAASFAASFAARSAAWSAAGSPAWSAARSTAESAAWRAARSAAESPAGSAAESPAGSAAEDKMNRTLEYMLRQLKPRAKA